MNYRFNEFDLDEESKTLCRAGMFLGLNGNQFRALLFLLKHSGTRTTREEIARFVWEKDETYLNKNDNDVDKLISALRSVLGDDPKNPTLIQTVLKSDHPDRGYMFIANVEETPSSNSKSPGSNYLSGVDDWVKILNKLPDVKVYGLVDKIPEISVLGDFEIENELVAAVQKRAEFLRSTNRDDSVLGVVDNEPDIFSIPISFEARLLRYSGLSLLRERDKSPFVLSSNAVLVSPKHNSIIVDVRSAFTDTYQSRLHTFGGAYEHGKDNMNLKTTAIREIAEETSVPISIKENTPILLCQEISNRFLQIVFLGVQVADDELRNLSASWESQSLRQVPFNELKDQLKIAGKHEWVPTGRAHILAWLACGAPGAPSGSRFNGLTAQELFSEIIKEV